jgi:hypothetical protein
VKQQQPMMQTMAPPPQQQQRQDNYGPMAANAALGGAFGALF